MELKHSYSDDDGACDAVSNKSPCRVGSSCQIGKFRFRCKLLINTLYGVTLRVYLCRALIVDAVWQINETKATRYRHDDVAESAALTQLEDPEEEEEEMRKKNSPNIEEARCWRKFRRLRIRRRVADWKTSKLKEWNQESIPKTSRRWQISRRRRSQHQPSFEIFNMQKKKNRILPLKWIWFVSFRWHEHLLCCSIDRAVVAFISGTHLWTDLLRGHSPRARIVPLAALLTLLSPVNRFSASHENGFWSYWANHRWMRRRLSSVLTVVCRRVSFLEKWTPHLPARPPSRRAGNQTLHNWPALHI